MWMRMVYIDFDDFRQRIFELRQCLIDFLPCRVRISAGGNGLHIKKLCNNESEYSSALILKKKHDDPKRLAIDEAREKVGLNGEILFFSKNIGEERGTAGEWKDIENESDVMNLEVLLCL
jgi:hypothetical protein